MTTQNHTSTPIESGYVPVNGLEMYYEIHGIGRPLVLLHGNLSTIATSFGKVLPKLSSTRRIIAIEQQGHGHTADIDRPLSIEQWAQDTTALLRHLGIEQADFVDAIANDHEPEVSGEQGLRSLALVVGLLESEHLGRMVTLAEMLRQPGHSTGQETEAPA